MNENNKRGEQKTEPSLGSANQAIEDLEPEQEKAAAVIGGFQAGAARAAMAPRLTTRS